MDPLDNLPWYLLLIFHVIDTDRVEKYRPTTLNDVVGNEEIVSRLRIIAISGNMPHLLLAVPILIIRNQSHECRALLAVARRQASCAWLVNFWDPNS